MTAAAVGHQCPDCVRQGAASVREPRTQFGGTLRTDNRPWVTWTLIAVNVVMFLLQNVSEQVERELWLWPPAVAFGDEYYRLVSSAFLHGSVTHILFNMWALYVVGPQLEAVLGRLRFGVLYALSGLGGSLAVYWLSALESPTLGASGAIFGLFAATFVVGRRLNLDVRWVLILIALNLVITFAGPAVGTGPISWQGHLGGLITGALVAAAFVYAPKERRNTVQISVSVALLVLFVVLVLARTSVIHGMFPGTVTLG